ncbi:hypothetical protein HN51_040769, partial [Arachis hypogaea]
MFCSAACITFCSALLCSCHVLLLTSCSTLLRHVRSSARVILKHSLCSAVVSSTSSSQVSQHRLCNSFAVSFKLYDLDSTCFIECQEIADNGKTLSLFIELQTLGQTLKVNITNPEHIKKFLTNNRYFMEEKPNLMRLATLMGSGFPNYEDQQWHTHRKIINPAFHHDKLKVLTSTMIQCCEDVITKWEEMLSSKGKCDIDVWPSIQNLDCDVISRIAFRSSYQEGKRIFELLTKQARLVIFCGKDLSEL